MKLFTITLFLFVYGISYNVSCQELVVLPDTTIDFHQYSYADFNIKDNELYLASRDYDPFLIHNSSKADNLLEGYWKIDYKRLGKSFYYLANYKAGQIVGKQYFFNSKGKLIAVKQDCPIIMDTVFNGTQINHYDKKERLKNIQLIPYNLSDSVVYTNEYSFRKSGNLEGYFYFNQSLNEIRTIKFNCSNEVVSDLSVNTSERDYFNRWSRNRRIMVSLKREGDQMLKEVYFNNRLIKVKVTRYSF